MSEEPIDAVLAKLDKAKKDPRGWTARCPAHEDTNRSLSIAYTDGKVLLNCFAGCEAGAIAEAMGMQLSDLFAPDPMRETRSAQKRAHGGREGPGVTLAELAAHKKLDEGFLAAQLGWRDLQNGRNAVGIPYPNGRMRIRSALSAKDGSSWAPGEGMVAYDMRPESARQLGYVVIVEGETDCATLLQCGFPAIGLPGATTQKTIEAAHLTGLGTVFAVAEPDAAGERFPDLVRKRLKHLQWGGAFHALKMPDAAKDPSALYQRDPQGFPKRFVELMALAAAPPEAAIPTLARAIPRMLRPLGSRLRTALTGLDEVTRGGIPLGSYVVLVGAPGAAKTTISVCLADRFERQGCHVLYLAADESARGIVTRLGQLEGFSRAALEDGGGSVQTAYAERAEGRTLYICDPDPKGLFLEDAADFLIETAKEQPAVLIVDSLQTVRCKAAHGAESALDKTDAVVATCKRYARRGALVVALSEMSKAGYRGGKDGAINALSSAKGSASIEFGVDLLVALTREPGGRVAARVAKNRLGRADVDLMFALDLDRADVSEVEMPDPGSEEKLRRAEQVVLSTIRERDCRSRNEVLRYSVIGRNWGLSALTALIDSGRIKLVGGFIREL